MLFSIDPSVIGILDQFKQNIDAEFYLMNAFWFWKFNYKPHKFFKLLNGDAQPTAMRSIEYEIQNTDYGLCVPPPSICKLEYIISFKRKIQLVPSLDTSTIDKSKNIHMELSRYWH